MGRRIHFPFIVDLWQTNEPADVRHIADNPKLDRILESRGPLINRVLSRRIRSVLTVKGTRLPAVAPRADVKRASGHIELRSRLDELSLKEAPLDEGTIAALADAVRKPAGAPLIAVLAQQAVGQIFNPHYVANEATLQAARVLYAAVGERSPLRYLAWTLSGRIAKAQRVLCERVNGEPAGVHATGIAVHNLVRGLERMHELWRDPIARAQLPVEKIVQQCIFAPTSVLRQATDETAIRGCEVRPGALVVMNLDEAQRRACRPDVAFMENAWSYCPAANFVPALLAAVWKAACAAPANEPADEKSATDAPGGRAAEQCKEVYQGGSPEAERLFFEQLAKDILHLQVKAKQRTSPGAITRAAYSKQLLAVTDARLHFAAGMPEDLRVGYAQPGRSYNTTIRFSNHSPTYGSDIGSLCGIALRVEVSPGESHDLLLTNFPSSPARDARQFVGLLGAQTGNLWQRWLGIGRLVAAFGPAETVRMLRTLRAKHRRTVLSLGLETYWSGSAIRWGDRLAVRYLLRPFDKAAPVSDIAPPGAGRLRSDLAGCLRAGDLVFELCVQRFVDEVRTPVEDASIAWSETVSVPVPIATLTIPQQDVETPQARTNEHRVDQLAFNPWHTTADFKPLGNLNRARKAVYAASAAHRVSLKFYAPVPLRNRIMGGLARAFFRTVNRYVPWYRLSLRLSLFNLATLRHSLRQHNLIDIGRQEAPPAPMPVASPIPEEVRCVRTHDGSFNDLSDPTMGMMGTAFGRNMKPVYTPHLFDTPNPVVVSDELLARTTFIPATSLNVLSAAWIQFQVHDWVHHDRHPLGTKDVEVQLPGNRTWRNHVHREEERVMRFGDNIQAEPRNIATGWPPILFANQATHWWDASAVYGVRERARCLREKIERNGAMREGAKLRLTPDGYLPKDANGMQLTGFNESWWLGLSAMHTLFAREHNTICDALRSEYPNLSDERIYQTARLVVSALIAKIHTVEWTPAILGTRVLELGLKTSWFGPGNDALTRFFLWLIEANALTGIPQTLPDHHTAPYSLTEEFVTVYRMHQLIPDDYLLFDLHNKRLPRRMVFDDIQGKITDEVMRETKLENVLYSFGIAHPGAVTLHNFPEALRSFVRENGERIDLAVLDLVRTRRRGVPRYNDFREALRKPRISRWEDLTENPESVRRLKDIYKDINLLDTVVGLLAETPPEGFGFSDTAFRIFILMASRRLQSDRFLTVDFRPEIYTPLGMDWVERNGMTSVILRHCPELQGALPRSGNAFAPWRSITSLQ